MCIFISFIIPAISTLLYLLYTYRKYNGTSFFKGAFTSLKKFLQRVLPLVACIVLFVLAYNHRYQISGTVLSWAMGYSFSDGLQIGFTQMTNSDEFVFTLAENYLRTRDIEPSILLDTIVRQCISEAEAIDVPLDAIDEVVDWLDYVR